MNLMQQRPKPLVIFFLIMALSAGFAAAHDSSQPHIHDPADELGEDSVVIQESQASILGSADDIYISLPENHPPVAIMVVSADGKLYSLGWLLRHVQSQLTAGEDAATSAASHPHQYARFHAHEHAHSHFHLHAHDGAHAHEHPQTGAPTEPHAHWHDHSHVHAHSHYPGMPTALQRHPRIQDEAIPADSSTRFS